MATAKWGAPDSISTIMTTEMNSLANGSYSSVGTEVDNGTDLALYGAFELALASLNPSAGGYCNLYLVPSVDGTNYADGGGSVVPSSTYLVGTFPLNSGTGTKRVSLTSIVLPPYKFKPVIENRSGVSLASSGSTLKIRKNNEASS